MPKHVNMNSIYFKATTGQSVFHNNEDVQAKPDCKYHNQLIRDCVYRLSHYKTEPMYCYTEEQLNAIIAKCKYELEYTVIENYGYELRRKAVQ